jgi:hypothetical protein
MKRSRLNLFKTTSMTISVLGVIMILATIAVFAYLGFLAISSTISSDVGTGSAYDQVAVLRSDYNSLSAQYSNVKIEVNNAGSRDLSKAYANAELQLIKAQSAITDAESAISSGKSNAEIQNRIKIAKDQLETAKASLNSVRSMF